MTDNCGYSILLTSFRTCSTRREIQSSRMLEIKCAEYAYCGLTCRETSESNGRGREVIESGGEGGKGAPYGSRGIITAEGVTIGA